MSEITDALSLIPGNKIQSPKWWASPIGGLVLIVVSLLIISGILRIIGEITLFKCGLLFGGAFFVGLGWLLKTKRLYLRDGFLLSTIWMLVIAVISYFYYQFGYHLWVESTIFDVPYIQYWGSFVVFVSLFLILIFVEYNFVKRKKLLLIVAVNNVSDEIEKSVLATFRYAVENLQKDYPYIELELLPFNLYDGQTKYQRYMKRPLVQADALLYASIMDDGKNYVITDFSMCANYKLLRLNREDSEGYLKAIEMSHKQGHSWEVLDSADSVCKARIKLGDDLYNLVLMYVSCLYLLKNDFDKSLPIVEQMYKQYRSDLGPIGRTANHLFGKALMDCAYAFEIKTNDYPAAIAQLNICAQTFPFVIKNLEYQTAMARLCYHIGDIRSSKFFTSQIRFADPWGYDLNMGFYAICENKVGEFVSRYRKLFKDPTPDKDQLDFAISFLIQRRKEFSDDRRKMMLTYAIASLYSYDSYKKANRELPIISFANFSEEERKSLSALQNAWRYRK